jgi:transposase
MIITDKGFASTQNINDLLTGPLKSDFAMSLPFTMKFAQKFPIELKNSIMTAMNIIPFVERTWGTTLREKWQDGSDIFIHAYFNPQNQIDFKYKIDLKINNLIAKINKNGISKVKKFEYIKWINFDQNTNIITLNDRNIEKATVNSGWLILLSNFLTDKIEALRIYRSKDVVEKGFFRLKVSRYSLNSQKVCYVSKRAWSLQSHSSLCRRRGNVESSD